MEFKFDTKDTYTVITPLTDRLDVNLTEHLVSNIDVYTGGGCDNFIIDLHHCETADITSFDALVLLHQSCYGKQRSLVFTGLHPVVLQMLLENDVADLLNIAPTMQEAIDIISMEILEGDLFNEE